MEDIKVGEYVRTVHGKIAKIEDIEFDIGVKFDTGLPVYREAITINGTDYIKKDVIKKHSFKPIDLIEVGDYVNGHKVYESDDGLVIFNIDDFEYFVNPMGLDLDKYRVVLEWQDENYIKNVVTKEQFEREKYIVGGAE